MSEKPKIGSENPRSGNAGPQATHPLLLFHALSSLLGVTGQVNIGFDVLVAYYIYGAKRQCAILKFHNEDD